MPFTTLLRSLRTIRWRTAAFAGALALGVAVAGPAPLGTLARPSPPLGADPQVLAALTAISNRLGALETEITHLRAEAVSANRGATRDEPRADPPTRTRLAELERSLARTAASARAIERSLARIDAAQSTPAALEQRAADLRALGRR